MLVMVAALFEALAWRTERATAEVRKRVEDILARIRVNWIGTI